MAVSGRRFSPMEIKTAVKMTMPGDAVAAPGKLRLAGWPKANSCALCLSQTESNWRAAPCMKNCLETNFGYFPVSLGRSFRGKGLGQVCFLRPTRTNQACAGLRCPTPGGLCFSHEFDRVYRVVSPYSTPLDSSARSKTIPVHRSDGHGCGDCRRPAGVPRTA